MLRRLDLEGLRALSIGVVLLFHAGVGAFAGGYVGVDVFFVLSGFFITGQLTREVAESGRVRLAAFWARRARRLLPASGLVLLASAAITWIWLPPTQRSVFGGDIASAALYVVNWRLADRAVDYLGGDVNASPVQHFWSLAVEEQFYVVWPILMLLVALAFRRRWRLGSFVVLGGVTVVSFAWSVHQATSSPQTAFFVSTTRVWELGVGALLALAAGRIARVPGVVRSSAGWLGLAAIAWATLAFDGSTTWPGAAALVPTLGAAAVIAAGLAPAPWSPAHLMSWAPLVWVGGLSYSLYLWHWPLLIAGQAWWGDDVSVREGLLLVAVSFVPAWLSQRLIENPIRFGSMWRPSPRALLLGAAITVVGVIAGAGVGRVPVEAGDLVLHPSPASATQDLPAPYVGDTRPRCDPAITSAAVRSCTWGDPDGERTVVIAGDSKIVQWQPALDAIAADEGWRLVQITKSSCPLADAHQRLKEKAWPQCHDWVDAAMDEIRDLHPDLVLTSQRYLTGAAAPDGEPSVTAMVAAMGRTWTQLQRQGIPVAVVLDNPVPPTDAVYDCVAQHPDDVGACAFDKAEGIARSAASTQQAAIAATPGVATVDLTDVICPGDTCPAVRGDILIYRDGSHVTKTYAEAIRPQVAAALSAATDGAFGSG